MTDITGSAHGRTDWRRFAVAAVPASAAAVVLVGMMSTGAVAASVGVSGSSFKVSFDELNGQGFQQYVTLDSDRSGTKHPVAPTMISTMEARNMCQSVRLPAALGSPVLRITAGDGAERVHASD